MYWKLNEDQTILIAVMRNMQKKIGNNLLKKYLFV